MPTELDLTAAISTLKTKIPLHVLLKTYGVISRAEDQQILCPFHAESVASARYYVDSDSIYCFVCNKNWDLIDFVKSKNSFSTADAVKHLANLADVSLTVHEKDAIPETAKAFYKHLSNKTRKERPVSDKLREQSLHHSIVKLYNFPWMAGFRPYALSILDFYWIAVEQDKADFKEFKEVFRHLQELNSLLGVFNASTSH